MIYTRGSPHDFDSWPASWNYPHLVPFFDHVESRLFQSAFDEEADTYRLADRRSSAPPFVHPLSLRFLEAGQRRAFHSSMMADE